MITHGYSETPRPQDQSSHEAHGETLESGQGETRRRYRRWGMTLRQYFAHLLNWILSFPRWGHHTTVGLAGGNERWCITCNYSEVDDPEGDE